MQKITLIECVKTPVSKTDLYLSYNLNHLLHSTDLYLSYFDLSYVFLGHNDRTRPYCISFFSIFESTIPTVHYTKYKKWITISYNVAITKNKSDLDKNDYYTLRQYNEGWQQKQFFVNQTCKSNKHNYVLCNSNCWRESTFL